ncbi:MAG: superoxide dismutase [Bacteroidota bacterium]|nr:superoxide dismutase [Bacteroidota bacterium]
MENETITEELEKGASNTTYKLPELPYAYDAMEPYIDKMTMEIHHDKHHSGYVNNLNKALEGLKYLPTSLDELLKNISKYNLTIKNNAGGHYNHSLFWKIMKFKGGGVPSGKLLEAINTSFGSFENFKNKFNEAATKIFGSGWAWLVVKDGKLEIGITQNQDNPLMDTSEFKGTPILCVDIWEHAYYLNYQNKRSEYIANWWNVLNWEEIQNIYENNK